MVQNAGLGYMSSFHDYNQFAMFDFEKLKVYGLIRALNRNLLPFIFRNQKDYPYLCDQLKRASLSAMLNLAEGVGRESAADKRQFYVRSRSSVFECVSILHVLLDIEVLQLSEFEEYYEGYEEISKAVLGLIRSTKYS